MYALVGVPAHEDTPKAKQRESIDSRCFFTLLDVTLPLWVFNS